MESKTANQFTWTVPIHLSVNAVTLYVKPSVVTDYKDKSKAAGKPTEKSKALKAKPT